MTESLATGTYEVLRNRLREAAADLRNRFERLHAARAEVFGNIETKLGATAHVTTDHNCIPRDLLAVGNKILLGYNVQFGLKTDIKCSDVFSVFRLEDDVAHTVPLEDLFTAEFQRDFEEVYRYYKQATFSRFFIAEPNVYFVFQVGKSPTDIKAFKWVLSGDSLKYLDNRSDHEVRFPEQHAFRWLKTTREQHRSGLHPHVSIDDIVFVECVGGDLTIKIEDNTEDGSGIYAEPVDNPDQTLDDAEVHYCILGNLILLRMRPYQEKDFRHLVYSIKRQEVTRLDAMAKSCVLLPDDHGIIFPGGMFLQTGAYKVFDHGLEHLLYERTIAAQNGEDYLYLFTDPVNGTYLHLRYNLIRQEVDTPLVCQGQAFFEDGQMVSFRAIDSPQKHHSLQMWHTPFVGPNYRVEVETDSMLYKIGNRELVRGMAECQELLQLTDKDDSYSELYADLEKRATDILDSYFWLNRQETMRLDEPLTKIRDTASAAVEEFDKVVRVRRETESATAEVQDATDELLKAISRSQFDSIEDFVSKLADLREQRGHAIGLKERRYVDESIIASLEAQLVEATERVGVRCVQFLLHPKSLEPYHKRIVEAESKIGSVKTAADGRQLQTQLTEISSDLELLIETVSQLKIDDLTQRTSIVDRSGDLLAELNRVRSTLKSRVRDLLSGEMQAEFASQTKLLDQAVAGALDTADTPEKVDESLTRIMLQVEELEGRFAEFDELLLRLTEKRESLYEAFEARRQQLVEARSRRADSLAAAADRILQGIASRSQRLKDAGELRSYFASDPMVDKVRQITEQLQALGDTVRFDDIISRLKSISDDSLRQLRDRQDLYSGDDQAIRLGKHHFNVNKQPIELTSVVRGGELQIHLTGTQFYQPLSDPALDGSRDLWQQLLPSESSEVMRAEFLAHSLFADLQNDPQPYLKMSPEQRIEYVRAAMQPRHDEGYSRGVHDRDTSRMLVALCEAHQQLGLLSTSPRARGVTWFVWQSCVPAEARQEAEQWLSSFRTIRDVLPRAVASQRYCQRLSQLLLRHGKSFFGSDSQLLSQGSQWLFAQLLHSTTQLQASPRALATCKHLDEHLPADSRAKLHQAMGTLQHRPIASWTLALDAVDAYLREVAEPESLDGLENYREEIAAILSQPDASPAAGSDVSVVTTIDGLVSDHPRIENSRIVLHYHEFKQRLGNYAVNVLPRFHALQETKQRLLQRADKELRTEEFKPKVLTSFVRNRLIDEVYLPLVGDNLAKQMGAAGDAKRTDRMGLLLLISPPGYGKTTLMEYIANRLGLVFVKVNGPALGHNITSLDPAEASNASAREEVKRINMALEMGDNVMLYLDDIQHCNPELLQKFIPLCDATRRIEGVWQGDSKTYDLRGRKVAVVMAGNPYTESGDQFQIPDMLANRADVYNLGEIIGDSREAFELSYLENCLTSNTVLQSLARASTKDQRTVIRAAERGTMEGLELEANISPDQLSDMLAVLGKLLRVRDIVLRVNRAYIRSAAQADAYRTEPPFKLQGSYRNMNRIAERVVPVMNARELESLVASNYEQDAQTLTRDGEANLLKFKELTDALTEEEAARWEAIRFAYVESVRMRGMEGEDTAAQVMRSLSGLRDGLESIRKTIAQAVASDASSQRLVVFEEALAHLSANLGALGSQVAEAISTGTERLQQTASQEPILPEQKVIVQHSVPRVMTDLVRSQFQLLYDGLRPVLEASAINSTQLQQLRDSVEDCLKQYRDLQAEIDASGQE